MPVYLPAFCCLDATQDDTLPIRIFSALRIAVRTGKLHDGDLLPSSRIAAASLGVSRATITGAYELLHAEGMIQVSAGRRPRVVGSPLPVSKTEPQTAPVLSARSQCFQQDLRSASYACTAGRLAPGTPDEAQFPAALWAQRLRYHARRHHGDDAAYGHYYGAPALRTALASRLAADRGMTVTPDQIVITPGTQASLMLITQIMTDPGDVVALEDPGYLGARTAFQASGVTIAPVPVDTDGLRVDLVPPDTRLISITPSNQFPLGVRMSLSRRLALLDLARRQGALILEDDYDSEFLWHRREIAALAAHGTGTETVYLGSAAKTLLPGLRLGWMVLPPSLVEPVRRAQRSMGSCAGLHAQLALADLMQSGQYRAHLRRIARLYRHRGLALYDALATLSQLVVAPPDGGVQLCVRLRQKGFEHPCQIALAQAGYRVVRLSALCHRNDMEGLIIGFATLQRDDTQRIVSTLRAILTPS